MRNKKVFVRLGALAVIAVMTLGQTAVASSGSENAALKATKYLKKQIREDGGFGTKASSISETSQAIIAFKAAGVDAPKTKTGKTPIGFLVTAAPTIANESEVVGNTAKISQMIIALKSVGENPKDFAGTNWLMMLDKTREKATGWYGKYAIDHIWAILALEAAGEKVPSASIGWLEDKQQEDGGFAMDPEGNTGSDTNTTALAIQALVGSGQTAKSEPVKKALAYLKTQQNKDGGFPFVTPSAYGTDSDSSSTAWVLQALVAADQDIEHKDWVKAAVTPMGFLMSLQNADGSFGYQKAVSDGNFLSTVQAIPALMSAPYPMKQEKAKSTGDSAASAKTSGTMFWALGGGFAVIVLGVVLYVVLRRKTA